MFGKKKYHHFFLILKNISIQGLNYRNTEIDKNGELFYINSIATYFANTTTDLVLFDVGANIGNYAKQLTSSFNKNATIYAFEPFSTPYNELQKLAKSNVNIKPFKIGLSDKNENLIVYSSDECSEIGGIYNRDFIFNDIPHNKQEINQFKTLDTFCEENKVNHINFLKIDVEGHEYPVLKGATSLIQTNKIDFIQFEFGAGNHFSRTFFMDFYHLLNKNYKLFRLLNDGFVEVVNYNSDLEMQILTYYVAVNKAHCDKFFKNVDTK